MWLHSMLSRSQSQLIKCHGERGLFSLPSRLGGKGDHNWQDCYRPPRFHQQQHEEGLPTHQPPVWCLASLQVGGQETYKQSQTKGLWGTGPMDTIRFQSPLVVRGNLRWECAASALKVEVCFRSCSQQAEVVRQHALPSVLPPTYLFLWS